MSKFITRRDFLKVSAVGALGAAASAAMGTALAAEAKAIYTPGTYSASEQGLEICLLKLCRIKPINPQAIEFARSFKKVWFYEEGILNGGIARTFSDMLTLRGYTGCYHIRAIADRFVRQMTVSEALHMLRLDTEGMVNIVKKELHT